MDPYEETPESVRRPRVVAVKTQSHAGYRGLEITLADRGVWRGPYVTTGFGAHCHDLVAEAFARRPDLFTFIERKPIHANVA